MSFTNIRADVPVYDSAANLPTFPEPGNAASTRDGKFYVADDSGWNEIGGGGGSGDVTGPSSSTTNSLSFWTDTTGNSIGSSSGIIAYSNNQLGIGNSSPVDNSLSAYKAVDGDDTWRNVESTVVVQTSGTGAYQEALYASARGAHNTGTVDLLRNYLTSEMHGDGTVTEAYGARAITRLYDQNAPGDTSSGLIQSGYGLEAYVGNVSTSGKIRTAIGVYISRAHATGSDGGGGLHRAVGLKIDNVVASGGDSNEAYTIDTSDSSAPILFGQDITFDTGFSYFIGNYSQPVGTIWTGGLKFRGNGYAILFETNNLAQDYTLRWPDTLGSSGQTMVIDSGSNLKFGSVADVAIQTTGTRPTASSDLRGKIWLEQGGAGVADVLSICVKDASDNYVWKTISIT